MSQYVPKAMFVQQHPDGWWVHDQHGPLDGPYARSDAIYVAASCVHLECPCLSSDMVGCVNKEVES